MNPTERIFAALQHSETARPHEKPAAAPPAAAAEPQEVLRVLATAEEEREALRHEEAASPAPVTAAISPAEEDAVVLRTLARRGRRIPIIVVSLGIAIPCLAAWLMRSYWFPGGNGHTPVSVAAASVTNRPSPTAPITPTSQAGADTNAAFVVTVHPEPAPEQTAGAPLTAEEQPGPEPAQIPERVFEPPPSKPVAASEHVVLAQPTLQLTQVSTTAEAPKLPDTVAGTAPPPPPVSKPKAAPVVSKVQPLELIRRVAPVYPDTARISHTEGLVHFRATIGKDGVVHKLLRISGPVVLAGAADRAIRQWSYRPALVDGQPVETVTDIEVDFRLANQ